MFRAFPKHNNFHGFPKKSFGGKRQGDWNGIPCDFWLDPSHFIYSDVDGGRVETWADRIGGVVWSQPTLNNRPFFRASDLIFNNNPVVESTSALHFMLNNNNASTLRTGRETFIAVVLQNTTIEAVVGVLFSGNQGAIQNGQFTTGSSNSTQRTLGIYNGANKLFTSTTENSTNPIILLISQSRILLNGVFETPTGSESAGLKTFLVYSRMFGNTGGFRWLGKLAEVLCFPFEPTEAEMLAVSDLLNAKYNIY